MTNAVARFREQARRRQSGRCHYCSDPMWEPGDETEATFSARHGTTPRQTRALRCTAEHRLARCDGGADAADNIVAACATCNRRRHAQPRPPASDAFLERVRRRRDRGHWHPWPRKGSGPFGRRET